MHNLACLLIPLPKMRAQEEIFPQSPVITDTGFFRRFSCETNTLRDLCVYARFLGANL